MSRESNEINPSLIKLENDIDDVYSTMIPHMNSSSTAYKGKIEVTSKGRRKIFDGVRWQILCRRPDCQKQTNKKSLCITHYKEEYQTTSWSNDDHLTQFHIDEQTNHSTNIDIINSNHRMIHDQSIRYMHNGRRCIFKNGKWQPLCKYDQFCRNLAKYNFLCIEHYQLMKGKQQKTSNYPRLLSSIIPYEKNKRLKNNNSSMISSSVTEQFDIHSNENSTSLSKSEDMNLSSVVSKYSVKIDQFVQTDLTIPLCCMIDQKDHEFFSQCTMNRKS